MLATTTKAKKETGFEVFLEEFKSNIWVVLPGEAN